MATNSRSESTALAEAIATEFLSSYTGHPHWEVQSWIRSVWNNEADLENGSTRHMAVNFWFKGDKNKEYTVILTLQKYRTLSRKKPYYWTVTSGAGEVMGNWSSRMVGFTVALNNEIAIENGATCTNPFS